MPKPCHPPLLQPQCRWFESLEIRPQHVSPHLHLMPHKAHTMKTWHEELHYHEFHSHNLLFAVFDASVTKVRCGPHLNLLGACFYISDNDIWVHLTAKNICIFRDLRLNTRHDWMRRGEAPRTHSNRSKNPLTVNSAQSPLPHSIRTR